MQCSYVKRTDSSSNNQNKNEMLPFLLVGKRVNDFWNIAYKSFKVVDTENMLMQQIKLLLEPSKRLRLNMFECLKNICREKKR